MSDESPIIFTESCCTKVADLIAEENNPDLKLRVFVNGGGCSGFQYGFTFDEIKNDDDFEIQKKRADFPGRSDELSIFGRRGNRLHRKPARFPIRYPQSECGDHLRLRFFIFRLIRRFLKKAVCSLRRPFRLICFQSNNIYLIIHSSIW